MLSTGFPEERPQLPPDLHPYWDVRQDLSVDQGIILLGQWLVIPAPLRPSVLRSLHASHQGETRTLRRARQVVFWPKMTNDIRNIVRSCSACATFSPSQPFEPVLSDQRAVRPFEKCATDLFQVRRCPLSCIYGSILRLAFRGQVWTKCYHRQCG